MNHQVAVPRRRGVMQLVAENRPTWIPERSCPSTPIGFPEINSSTGVHGLLRPERATFRSTRFTAWPPWFGQGIAAERARARLGRCRNLLGRWRLSCGAKKSLGGAWAVRVGGRHRSQAADCREGVNLALRFGVLLAVLGLFAPSGFVDLSPLVEQLLAGPALTRRAVALCAA